MMTDTSIKYYVADDTVSTYIDTSGTAIEYYYTPCADYDVEYFDDVPPTAYMPLAAGSGNGPNRHRNYPARLPQQPSSYGPSKGL